MAKKKKYYVVWVGHTPGIYDSWKACQEQVTGFPGAKYKSFPSREAAEEAYHESFSKHHQKRAPKPKMESLPAQEKAAIVWESIAVDAACAGNPGKMEYQGVDTKTGERLFHKSFPLGTNNIGEFLALVHGLAYLAQQGSTVPVYSDSRNAINWVKAGRCRTTLKKDSRTATLFEVIRRAETWLTNNTFPNQLLKWNTERWGEIPADFGRKK